MIIITNNTAIVSVNVVAIYVIVCLGGGDDGGGDNSRNDVDDISLTPACFLNYFIVSALPMAIVSVF